MALTIILKIIIIAGLVVAIISFVGIGGVKSRASRRMYHSGKLPAYLPASSRPVIELLPEEKKRAMFLVRWGAMGICLSALSLVMVIVLSQMK